MKIYRPLWNEGALLSPQQFQQQSEWETFRSTGVAALASPFAWGVERAEFDERLLGSGLLQITHLRLWLPDSTLVDAAVSDLPPEPRELGASQLSDVVTVVIALPLMQSGLNNVQQESAVADRPLRYREEWVNVQDAFGSEDESVAVARFNLANQSAINQASRHQAVATVNQPLKIVWIFMQPVSHEYFRKIFIDYKDIITRWQP